MNDLQEQRTTRLRFTDEGNPVTMLIVLNVLFFILLNFIEITYILGNAELSRFQTEVMQWFTLPALPETLFSRAWVVFTHMFTHDSIWRLIGNMFFLWAFGFLLQDLVGPRHTVPLYIYGAIAGAFLFVLSVNVIPRFAGAAAQFHYTGAGAAIMGIAVAATATAPDYRIFPMINGGIPLWVITLIYVIVDVAGLASMAFPHHLAHLGGAVTGFVYIRAVQRGAHPGEWMHRLYHWFFNLGKKGVTKTPKPSLKKQVFYKTKGNPPFKKTASVTQQRIDALLDKISQDGYDSLTQEEKEILKRAGEKDF